MSEKTSVLPHILQVRDVVSNREFSLRLEPEDVRLPLGGLLECYLRHAPIERLLEQSRITPSSADSLFAVQDLVYASDDHGRLLEMFDGIGFANDSRPFGLNDAPTVHTAEVAGQEIALLDVEIDRIACDYDRNWIGFHARKWKKAPERYASFVRDALVADHGVAIADDLLELRTARQRLMFLESLARRVWNSQFENYSRFSGQKLVYKSGDETIDNVLDGDGGICSEKVQALKFLTDHFGLESEYLIAGPDADGPVPADKLREILTTFDPSFAKRYMRYWQHTALLYRVDGVEVLVDATNGNVPFLFRQGCDADRLLRSEDKRPVPVRMVEAEEDFYYHRVPQDIPKNLFFALEGWMSFSDLMQVFDNELGLFLSADFHVAPIAYRSEKAFQRDREQFLEVCGRGRLQCCITEDWSLDTPLGRAFEEAEPDAAAKILSSRDHLLQRVDQCDGPGHEAGLVVIRLRSSGPVPTIGPGIHWPA